MVPVDILITAVVKNTGILILREDSLINGVKY